MLHLPKKYENASSDKHIQMQMGLYLIYITYKNLNVLEYYSLK